MGFPASGMEALYRNNIDDVATFLNDRHNGNYMVYNLCATKRYDHGKFNDHVVLFPINEDGVPKFDDLELAGGHSMSQLSADDLNIAAIHNKNGKGTVGIIIVCYLLYKTQYKFADKAIEYFNKKRCDGGDSGKNALSQPSHIDGHRYYEKLCILRNSEIPYQHQNHIKLKIFIDSNAPKFNSITIKPAMTEYKLNKNNTNHIVNDDGYWIMLNYGDKEKDWLVSRDF